MVGCPSELSSFGSARALRVSTAPQGSEPVSRLHPWHSARHSGTERPSAAETAAQPPARIGASLFLPLARHSGSRMDSGFSQSVRTEWHQRLWLLCGAAVSLRLCERLPSLTERPQQFSLAMLPGQTPSSSRWEKTLFQREGSSCRSRSPPLAQCHPQSDGSSFQADKQTDRRFLGQGCRLPAEHVFPSVRRGLAVVPSAGAVSGHKLPIYEMSPALPGAHRREETKPLGQPKGCTTRCHAGSPHFIESQQHLAGRDL